MIIELNIENNLGLPIVINSQSATGQPIRPNGALQATFSVQENENGIAVLHLYIDPGE